MRCVECGKTFTPRPHGAGNARYCSTKCRERAKRRRERMREDEPQPQQQPQHAEGGDLSRIDFQRMMDPSAEDIYRQCRDRLQQALDDPDTPRSALPAISKELTRVTDRLDRLEGGDPLLGGLEGSDTDDGSGTSEGSEQGATAAGRETV